MSLIKHQPTRRGDTMIEVMFGVAIFGLIAISSIGLMNNGLGNAETNLEATMARNEMDAQADALRFIHSTYAATNGQTYKELWNKIIKKKDTTNVANVQNVDTASECDTFYTGDSGRNIARQGFAIKTDAIQNASSIIDGNNALRPAITYPAIESSVAYGIWINIVASSTEDKNNKPYYYDFYIRSCWYGLGSSVPTMLDTVVRLYNPDRNS